MSKFKKRITKITDNLNNAVVYGTAFGKLEEITDLFNTVFIISNDPFRHRGKNLVYVPDLKDINDLYNITMTFVDLDKTDDMSVLIQLFTQGKSFILIEGNSVIERDKSKLLYKFGFRAVLQSKEFHVWNQIK